MRNWRIGIIGLSVHSAAFTEIMNSENENSIFNNSKVVALYEPAVNKDVEFSTQQISDFTSTIISHGVKRVDSLEALLNMSDAVMILTNDGRPHLDEVIPVFESGKPVFIDKPLSDSFHGVEAIFNASHEYNVPVFTSSALRYGDVVQSVSKGEKIGVVLGAETHGPAPLQDAHVDLFWDGVHGVELLYTAMGIGCQAVRRINKEEEDVIFGDWGGGRIGVFRGLRQGKKGFGGRAYGSDGIASIGSFDGYEPLVEKIVTFFRTGISPVKNEETIEIYAFMEAAKRSKVANGQWIHLADILNRK